MYSIKVQTFPSYQFFLNLQALNPTEQLTKYAEFISAVRFLGIFN